MIEKLKNFKWGYVLISIFLSAVGICLLSFNDVLKNVAIAIGIVLVLFAIVYGTVVLAGRDRGVTFAFKIIFAAICLVAGTVVAILHSATVGIMISVFSLLLIIDASFKLQTAIMSKRYSVALWWVILALSVAVIVGSYFLIKADVSEDKIPTVSIWLGVTLLVDALANLLSAFYVTIYEKRQYTEIRGEMLMEKIKAEQPVIEAAETAEEVVEEAEEVAEAPEEPFEEMAEEPGEDIPPESEETEADEAIEKEETDPKKDEE